MTNRDPFPTTNIETRPVPTPEVVNHHATKFAIDNFTRAMGREPTPHEMKWVGRWEPQAAVRLASLNPEGSPDELVSICIPNVWEDVSLYAELTLSTIMTKHGEVTGFRSLRYHNGDDLEWPMRTSTGEIIRNDGGHMLRSITFRAKYFSLDNVAECEWPVGIDQRAMWHVETFVRPLFGYIGTRKRVPRHFVVGPPPLVMKPKGTTREQELERRIAELESAGKKR